MSEREVLSMANIIMLMVLPGADFRQPSLKPAVSKNSASRRSQRRLQCRVARLMKYSQNGSAVNGCTGWRYFAASHTPRPPLHFHHGEFLYGKRKERQRKKRMTAVKHCNSTVEVGGLFVRRFLDASHSPFCYLYLFAVYNVVFESCKSTMRLHRTHMPLTLQLVDTSESRIHVVPI